MPTRGSKRLLAGLGCFILGGSYYFTVQLWLLQTHLSVCLSVCVSVTSLEPYSVSTTVTLCRWYNVTNSVL
jgi:hypothetical protein